MTATRPFVLTAALLPDHRIVTKVNTRDAAKAMDKILVLTEDDELYDEALSDAVSYVKLLGDGQLEIKAKFVGSEGANPQVSTRSKLIVPSQSSLHTHLRAIAGPLEPGKQVWLDMPKDL